MTIGDLARRSGVPVKTLRYYSDEGLLPPAERTRSGYRVYAEEAVLRLDLVRTLRDAGVGIAAIKAILARELALGDALRLRLRAVEAHVASLQMVAAALRAALRSEPNEDDIRRICAVTRLSDEERRSVIERFHARVAEGVPPGEDWKREVMAANLPRLPDEPTPAQLDAWIELAELVQDEGFVAAMRASAAEVWGEGFDLAAYQRASDEATTAARELLDRGVLPDSEAARTVVERMLAGLAAAMCQANDAALRDAVRARLTRQDARTARYWALVTALQGQSAPAWPQAEWDWLLAALGGLVVRAGSDSGSGHAFSCVVFPQ